MSPCVRTEPGRPCAGAGRRSRGSSSPGSICGGSTSGARGSWGRGRRTGRWRGCSASSTKMPSLRLFGIPLRIEATFFVTALVLGSGRGVGAELAIWVVVSLVSVLWHELGHALVARAFGLAPSIALHAWGGLTSFETERPLPYVRDLLISVAGPAAGLVLGALVYGLGAAVDLADAEP